MAFGVVWSVSAPSPADARSPMLASAEVLRCSLDEVEVEGVLARLAGAETEVFGVPGEDLSDAGSSEIRATSLNLLLQSLHFARRRWPHKQDEISALVSSWDFCRVTSGGEYWDLTRQGDEVKGYRPFPPSPFGSRGFLLWGLVPRRFHGRPRPGDGETFDRSPVCPGEIAAGPVEFDDRPRIAFGPLPHVTAENVPVDTACIGPPPRPPEPEEEPEPEPVVEAPAPPPEVREPPEPPPMNPVVEVAPGGTTMVGSADSGMREADTGLPLLGDLRLGGSVSFRQGLTGAGSVSLNLSLSPAPSFFVRGGMTTGLTTEFHHWEPSEPTFSWGLGYSDWRPGTISLQLNNWGPIKVGDPLEKIIRGASAATAYKFELPEGLASFLGASVSLTLPLAAWSPAIALNTVLKGISHLFLSVSVQYKPLAAKFLWSYVFGYSDWHPFTFSVVYANWGPNEILEHNFMDNGGITISFSFAI